jgi:hypothetical protein
MIIIIKLNFSFDQLVSEMISENLKIARKEELIKMVILKKCIDEKKL